MQNQSQTDRIETPHGALVTEDFSAAHMTASFDDEPLDEQCAAGLHSWINEVGRLPADTRCARCDEPYGNPK